MRAKGQSATKAIRKAAAAAARDRSKYEVTDFGRKPRRTPKLLLQKFVAWARGPLSRVAAAFATWRSWLKRSVPNLSISPQDTPTAQPSTGVAVIDGPK